jgi:putative FmdB family regulatory protein
MPTYEYACTRCGQHVEVVQSMSAPPLTECGACGGTLRKVFAPIGIVFKGSGFYRTDSRGKPSKKKEEAPAAKDSSTSTKAATSSPAPDSGTTSSKASEKSA